MPKLLEGDAPHNPDAFDRTRAAVAKRVEPPGISLFSHLDELRKRVIHSAVYLAAGYLVALVFAPELYSIMQAPLKRIQIQLHFTHPADLVNLRYMQMPLAGGTILPAPLILYQVWLFIAPGL